MKTVCAFGFVSIHDVNARRHQRQQSSYLADIVLAVAIRIENEVLGGMIESTL